ncbi:ribokinase [Terriglobus albidus]|uniref:Ribokinase n=1 Tax=Terriglobus albidus TaxID=1592106 RepID=A0A5B9E7J5_9BACT|nr:ribokinase [Terriglobus albidus]
MRFVRKSVLVIGSLNFDLVVHAERIPLAGETVRGSGYDSLLGGKGANQAIAAARLGAQVRMAGRVGSDSYGGALLDGLDEAAVDVAGVQVSDGPSGLAVITHSSDGQNAIVVQPGANGLVTAADIRALEFAEVGVVLLQLEIPMDAVVAAAQEAHKAGLAVILDPAPVAALPEELLRAVTWLTPNETEAAQLVAGSMEPQQTAERLLAIGCRNVALKLGERGAFLMGADCEPTLVPAFAVKAVDTTAAGDCFNGAFAVRLLAGDSPQAAARYANAAAAISVTRLGAQVSMPSRDEVEALSGNHG